MGFGQIHQVNQPTTSVVVNYPYLKASKTMYVPVFNGNPTLNGGMDSAGAIAISKRDSALEIYLGGSVWLAINGGTLSLGGVVKYTDSNTLYITKTKLNDSLNNYVTKGTAQTITGPKIFNANQTFVDTVFTTAPIFGAIHGTDKNRYQKVDSLNYIGTDPSNFFHNILKNPVYTKTANIDLPSVASITNTIVLSGGLDTMGNLTSPRGSLSAAIAFDRRSGSGDTLTLRNTSVSGSLRAASVGLSITDDSVDAHDNSLVYKIYAPVRLFTTYTNVSNNGYLDKVTDVTIGKTFITDDTGLSDSLFRIGDHRGIEILALKNGDSINQAGAALIQDGVFDSVIFNSNTFQLNNVPTSTLSYQLGLNNNILVKKVVSVPITTTLDFPATSAQSSSDINVTYSGAVIGDFVDVSWVASANMANSQYTARVVSANTVAVRFNNYSSGSQNPASGAFTLFLRKQP